MPRLTKAEKKELAQEVKAEAEFIIKHIEDRFGPDASVSHILNHLILEIAILKLEVKVLDEVKINREA